MPVSLTANSTQSRPSATFRTRSATSPWLVNLQELLNRLSRICRSRIGSTVKGAEIFLALRNQTVLVLLGKLSRSTDYLVDQRGQGHGLRAKLELASFNLREVEHLIDEAKKVLTGAVYALQRLLRLIRAEARRVADHHLGQPDDGVKWGTKLVAHTGEELRLAIARLRQLLALILDFVEQPHILDCDYRLVGEGGHQLDLSIREASDGSAHEHDHADRRSLAQERNAEYAASTKVSGRISQGELVVVQNVGYMDDIAF